MDRQMIYEDLTMTFHYPLFGGEPTVTICCRAYNRRMSLDEFAELVYPAISGAARGAEIIGRNRSEEER
jgi:hypothetical protein